MGPSSSARLFVIPTTACLDTAYALVPREALNPDVDARFTMTAPGFITRAASRAAW